MNPAVAMAIGAAGGAVLGFAAGYLVGLRIGYLTAIRNRAHEVAATVKTKLRKWR